MFVWWIGVAGTLAVGDMDADGYTDMIISGYSANKIFVYTYKPE